MKQYSVCKWIGDTQERWKQHIIVREIWYLGNSSSNKGLFTYQLGMGGKKKSCTVFKNVSKSMNKGRLDMWFDIANESVNVEYTWNNVLAKWMSIYIQSCKIILIWGCPFYNTFLPLSTICWFFQKCLRIVSLYLHSTVPSWD